MRTAARVAIALVASQLAACAELQPSSDVDDPLGESSILSVASSVALGAGFAGLFTRRPGTGEAVLYRREIALSIARGQGPFVTDLAAWLALPEPLVTELGRVLREARPVLEPALSEEISVEGFQTLIGVALCRDPVLRYHAWRRFHCERLVPWETVQVAPPSQQ